MASMISEHLEKLREYPIELTMAGILVTLVFVVLGLALFQRPHKFNRSTWLADPENPCKREFEQFALIYTVVWISAFAVVVVTGMYEQFDENSYMLLCTTLAAPFLLQPVLFPLPTERKYRWYQMYMRYSFKANVWIAIFSFVGNYWYTHYFYSVLQARYTFPAHRLNDVPIALYFATHFYFVTYHTFANLMLRKVETTFSKGIARSILFWTIVVVFSYFTAFMESLTISSFPYYSFADRFMAYTVGSAFYGIYFLVSFPVFYRLDEGVVELQRQNNPAPHTLYQTVMEAAGASMIVLCLLDFCRLALEIPLTIPGVGYYLYLGPAAAAAGV